MKLCSSWPGRKSETRLPQLARALPVVQRGSWFGTEDKAVGPGPVCQSLQDASLLSGDELVKEDEGIPNGCKGSAKVQAAQGYVLQVGGDEVGKLVVPGDASASPQCLTALKRLVLVAARSHDHHDGCAHPMVLLLLALLCDVCK